MKKLNVSFLILAFIFYILPFSCFASSQFKIVYDKYQDVFWYNATVTKATTNTKYKVIGYTVHYDGMETTIKLEGFDDIDNKDGTVTVPIKIPAHNGTDSVMNRFYLTNPGHESDLIKMWSTDCTVYFNAIMTIVEGPNQTPLAIMNSNGTFSKPGGSKAQLGIDYFTSVSSIKTARSWKAPSDLESFFNLQCEMNGFPAPPEKLDKPVARIYKNGTVVTGALSYMDNEDIYLTGSNDSDFPDYADHRFYRWEYKPSSSSSWTTLADGEGKISPVFSKLAIGNYNVRLTVWYGIGSIVYTNMSSSTQITLTINQSPQGAYVIAEPATDGDKTVTQSQIDANAAVNIIVTVKGTLKNYTDTGKITLWKNNLRKDPPGADDQFQAFAYTSGLGLTQTSQKTFTVRAGVLKNADTYTQKFVVSSYVTVNGQVLQSKIEYCSATLHKGTPPPPPTANKPPVAVISAPSTAKLGNDVFISGTGSYDPDGTVEGYLWGIQGPNLNSKDPYFSVTYSKTGDYNIFLEVTDNKGARGAAQQTITIVAPTPEAHFTVTGTKKEMRVITLTNTSSSPTRYPVSAAQNKWTITPVEGSGATADAVYKVTNKSAAKEKVAGDPYTATCLNGLNTPMVTFTKAGQYDVTLTITNTAGYSDATTQRITIQPDLPPVSKFKTETKIYRETIVNGVNYAKITVNDESYSPDGDFISYRKIWAVYDANNSGIFGDAGDQTIVISETSDRNVIETAKAYEYMTREVGRYDVHVTVKESYIP